MPATPNGPNIGDGGDARASTSGDEPSFLPVCEFPEVVVPSKVVTIGASFVFSSKTAPQIYAGDLGTQTMLARYRTGREATSWVDWICYDLLPRSARIAAMNLSNDHPEIFVTTLEGGLFVRRTSQGGQTPWLPFSLPTPSAVVTDVTALAGEVPPAVYVLADGGVHVRRKRSIEPYASYGPWLSLPTNDARLLTGGVDGAAMHRIYVVTSAGEIQHTAPSDHAMDAPFSEWKLVDALRTTLSDLDAARSTNGMNLFALTSTGAVLGAYDIERGVSWQELRRATDEPRFVAVAALTVEETPLVVGVTARGELFQMDGDLSLGNISWSSGG
jgi:hypothetical protein